MTITVYNVYDNVQTVYFGGVYKYRKIIRISS